MAPFLRRCARGNWLLLSAVLPGLGAAETAAAAGRGPELGEATASPGGKECPALDDENGRWSGSRTPGGLYTLSCAPGFELKGQNGSTSASIQCPESLLWPTELRCKNHDDCTALKHGCGAFGVCIDLINGYDCNCEEGYLRRRSHDGEIVCGGEHGDACGGHTCGAYGICIDLESNDSQFDTEDAELRNGTRWRNRTTGATYRCECTEGFFDDGSRCARVDCGTLRDGLGTWRGSTLFGQEYTLSCPEDDYVWGGTLSEITISCSAKGVWPSLPVCISPRKEAMDAEFATLRFWMNVVLALCCVTCGALAAGLTLGLTTLEPFDLAVKLETRPDEHYTAEEKEKLSREQQTCRKILPVIKDRHLLLVTLLLFNTVANESLPIFLDQLVPSVVAVLLSVTVVLFCGEVFPSAIFTGPNQFAIVSRCIPIVEGLMLTFYCLAKPIALLLDRVVGEESAEQAAKYSRAELRALLQLHCKGPQGASAPHEGRGDHGDGHGRYPLAGSELRMLDGILGLGSLKAREIPHLRRRECILACPQERADAVLTRALGQGARAVLLLERGLDAPERPAAPVAASSVAACILVKALMAGGSEELGSLQSESVFALTPGSSALDALRLLESRGDCVGLLLDAGPEGYVEGVVTQPQLLSGIMRVPPPDVSEDGISAPKSLLATQRLKQQRTHIMDRRLSRLPYVGHRSNSTPNGPHGGIEMESGDYSLIGSGRRPSA